MKGEGGINTLSLSHSWPFLPLYPMRRVSNKKVPLIVPIIPFARNPCVHTFFKLTWPVLADVQMPLSIQ